MVKKYKTYVARNKRLEGQGSSPSAGQQKTSGQTPTINRASIRLQLSPRRWKSLKPRLTHTRRPSRLEEGNPSEAESSLDDDDDGLYIPSYLEEAAPNDPVLQVRLARAMQAQREGDP